MTKTPEMKLEKITPLNQVKILTGREAFLQGVLLEAGHQGYSLEGQGRLFVVALRSWEKR